MEEPATASGCAMKWWGHRLSRGRQASGAREGGLLGGGGGRGLPSARRKEVEARGRRGHWERGEV
jgi:hypothetical protein